ELRRGEDALLTLLVAIKAAIEAAQLVVERSTEREPQLRWARGNLIGKRQDRPLGRLVQRDRRGHWRAAVHQQLRRMNLSFDGVDDDLADGPTHVERDDLFTGKRGALQVGREAQVVPPGDDVVG